MQKRAKKSQAGSKSGSAVILLENFLTILSESNDDYALAKISSFEQAALLRNLLFIVSRQRAVFDYLLDKHCQRSVRLRLRRIFWWALAELFFLDGLPIAVTVDVACAFAKKRYSRSEASFLNAVLRKFALIAEQGALDKELQDAPDYVKLRLPEEMHKQFLRFYPADEVAHWAELWQQPAELILRRRKTANLPIPEELEEIESFPWTTGQELFQFKTGVSNDLQAIPDLFNEFYVQDPSTLLAPYMLAVKEGEIVADLCSAPGGKSLLIAEALGEQGKLYCRDRSDERLEALRENLLAYPQVDIKAEDALSCTLPENSLDAILLDVPCSNTGVIRRRPDVRWTYSVKKLRELQKIQRDILEKSEKLLKKGGRMLYSTCSIEKEENSLQIKKFLERNKNFTLIEEKQLLPQKMHDGAYCALLVRN